MKFKKSTLAIWLAALSALVLRALQIFYTIDQKTGFYKSAKTELGIALMVLVVALCVFAAVVARLCDYPTKESPKNSKLWAIASGILAISLFYETFNEQFVFGTTNWQSAAMKTMGFLTALYFAALVVFEFVEFNMPDFCHLLPAAYMIIRIICSFISIGSLSLITENIFLIAAYCALLTFFISYAADKYKVYINGASFYTRSVLAFMLCFITAFPNLIVGVVSSGNYSHIPLTSQVMLTATTLFIATFNHKKFLK